MKQSWLLLGAIFNADGDDRLAMYSFSSAAGMSSTFLSSSFVCKNIPSNLTPRSVFGVIFLFSYLKIFWLSKQKQTFGHFSKHAGFVQWLSDDTTYCNNSENKAVKKESQMTLSSVLSTFHGEIVIYVPDWLHLVSVQILVTTIFVGKSQYLRIRYRYNMFGKTILNWWLNCFFRHFNKPLNIVTEFIPQVSTVFLLYDSYYSALWAYWRTKTWWWWIVIRSTLSCGIPWIIPLATCVFLSWRQCPWVVRASDFKSGGRRFKSHSDHLAGVVSQWTLVQLFGHACK